MSTQNINYSNLDARYTKPTDVDTKIAAQATVDAGQYAPISGSTAYPTVAKTEALINGIPISGGNFTIPIGNVLTTAGTHRWRMWTYYSCANMRARFDNFSGSLGTPYGDIDGTVPVTITASVIVGNTTAYRLTFNGATSVTIQPGASVWCDAIGLEFDAGVQLDWITYVNSTNYYGNRGTPAAGQGIGGFVSGGDVTPSGSGIAATPTTVVPDTNSVVYAPGAVNGIPSGNTYWRSLIGSGDSIIAGVGDTVSSYGAQGSTYSTWTPSGWLERAAKNLKAGLLNMSKSSDQVVFRAQSSPSLHYRRAAFIRPGQIGVCELGINDMRQTNTQATIQAAMVAHWQLFTRRGAIAVQSTITPSSTSSDSFATVNNQTQDTTNSAFTKRVAINGWLRAGAPLASASNLTPVAVGTNGALVAGQTGHPLTAVIEVADIVESARDSGLWKAPNYTADGLHPSPTAHAAIATAIAPQLQTLLNS